MEQEEQYGVGETEETFSFADFYHVQEIASFLLELCKNNGVTTKHYVLSVKK